MSSVDGMDGTDSFNSYAAAVRWKLSAMSGEEFSVLLGIVNDAKGLTGNKSSFHPLRIINSGSSSDYLNGSNWGKRRRPLEKYSHLT